MPATLHSTWLAAVEPSEPEPGVAPLEPAGAAVGIAVGTAVGVSPEAAARVGAGAAEEGGVVPPTAPESPATSCRLSLERYSALTRDPTVRAAALATSRPTSTSPWAGQSPRTSQCPLRVLTRSVSMPATMYGLLLMRTVS